MRVMFILALLATLISEQVILPAVHGLPRHLCMIRYMSFREVIMALLAGPPRSHENRGGSLLPTGGVGPPALFVRSEFSRSPYAGSSVSGNVLCRQLGFREDAPSRQFVNRGHPDLGALLHLYTYNLSSQRSVHPTRNFQTVSLESFAPLQGILKQC
jgi:hypothetical protein